MVALGEGASNNDGNVERAVALDCAHADGTTRISPTVRHAARDIGAIMLVLECRGDRHTNRSELLEREFDH